MRTGKKLLREEELNKMKRVFIVLASIIGGVLVLAGIAFLITVDNCGSPCKYDESMSLEERLMMSCPAVCRHISLLDVILGND